MVPIIQFLHIFKWFQEFLSNTNNYTKYQLFVYTELNGFKFYNPTPIVVFAHSEIVLSISFYLLTVSKHRYVTLTTQFNISHLFAQRSIEEILTGTTTPS